MLTSDKTIQKRIQDAQESSVVKDVCYKLRQAMLGDETWNSDRKTTSQPGSLRGRKGNSKYPLLRIKELEEGVSNPSLQWLNILIQQVRIIQPELTWPDLDPEVSGIRESYIRDRLKKADFTAQQESIAWSLLVDGLSFVKLGYFDDLNSLRAVDLINLYWDQQADLPFEYRYIAEEICVPESIARKEFGDAIITKLRNGRRDETGENQIRLIEYWDKTTRAYLTISGGTGGQTILKKDKNPYGFIPYEVAHASWYPGLYSPIPAILRTIPTSIALNNIQRTIIERIRTGRPILELNKDAYTEESWADFEEAGMNVEYLVKEKSDAPGAAYVLAPDIGADLIQAKQIYDEELIKYWGANPFASGTAPNTKFATDSSLIQANSSLHQVSLSGQITDLLSRSIQKMIRVGYEFDDEPITMKSNGAVYKFRKNELKPLLKDDVPVEVTPGSFESDGIRTMKDERLFTMLAPIAQVPIANWTPLMKELVKRVLSNSRVGDISTLLTPQNPPEGAETPEGEAPQSEAMGAMTPEGENPIAALMAAQ